MRFYMRFDKDYPFTLIPIKVRKHTSFNKEWVVYWFNMRISIVWRCDSSSF